MDYPEDSMTWTRSYANKSLFSEEARTEAEWELARQRYLNQPRMGIDDQDNLIILDLDL